MGDAIEWYEAGVVHGIAWAGSRSRTSGAAA